MGKRTKEEQLAINAKAKDTKERNKAAKKALEVSTEASEIISTPEDTDSPKTYLEALDASIHEPGTKMQILVITNTASESGALFGKLIGLYNSPDILKLIRGYNYEIHFDGRIKVVFRCKAEIKSVPQYVNSFSKIFNLTK